MRTVALEEHFNIPFLVERIPVGAIRRRGFPPQDQMPPTTARPQAMLKELGDGRINRQFLDGLPLAPADVAKIAH